NVLAGALLARAGFAHRLGEHLRADRVQRPGAARVDLHVAGALQRPERHEGFGYRRTPGKQAVVAQDHRMPGANAGNEAILLALLDRDAFEVVVGDAAVELRRVEVRGREP